MKLLRRLCPTLLLMTFGLPAAAQQQEQGGSMVERVQLNGTATPGPAGTVMRVSQSAGEPLATTGAPSMQDSLNGALPTSRRTMLWAVHPSGVGVGFGVEQRQSINVGNINQPVRSAAMLAGVSMATGERSQIFAQTPLLAESANNNSNPLAQPLNPNQLQPRQVRVGMVFNTKNPYADLRKGLRMELSGQSTLSFRPRGGKIGVAFQKVW